jgi:signal transduction histidine kinase
MASAVPAALPPGTVVFESIAPGTADSGTRAEGPTQPLHEEYVAERQAESLATLERQRMTFFSDVSQECRTPLAFIVGPAANLLAGVHGPLTGEQRDQIRIVHHNAVHLLKLVNTLFTFLRIEAGAREAMWQLPDDIAPPAEDDDGGRPSAPMTADDVDRKEASWASFYAAASHELRNPIHSLQLQVLGILRGLQAEQRTPQLEWVRARVDKANDQLSRVIRLLDRLLDVSRISSGRLPLVIEAVDLAEVAATAIDWLEGAERAQIRCRFEPAAGRWDRLRLEQVVTNLVSNALKYGEGEPIDVLVQGDGRTARLSVTDRGIGIAPEHHQRIFQRFERAVTEPRYPGFGLGLWITRQIVDELGGTLSLRSAPGKGSTFVVELPIAPRDR